MKVAFTSSTGVDIDEHFGMATQFHVWEIGSDEATPLGAVAALPSGQDEDDRIAARANAIAGCTIVYTMQIGGPAAAKLVARKIHPIKTQETMPVADAVAKLQGVLRGTPPPWLRKTINPNAVPSFVEGEE